MKHLKKVSAVVLAFMMMLALTVTASAKAYTDGEGTITVNNAAIGETYFAIKALSATVSDAGIAYTGEIPDELKDVIEVQTITSGTATYQAIGQKEGVTDDQYQAAMRAFATANMPEESEGIKATGNSVKFTGLDLGFYVIVSTLNGKATNKVSAGSTFAENDAPNGQVYEKNETVPEPTKTVKDKSYSIGETITYTVSFPGANYIGAGKDAKIVTKYEISDTLPDFLSNAQVTKVMIGEEDKTEELDVSTFATEKKFDIPWAAKGDDGKYASFYPNGTVVTVTYTAVLTDTVNVNADNTNTVTITPYVDTPEGTPEGPQPWDEPWSDQEEITTYAAALKKTDGTDALAGAKFAFKGLTVKETVSGEKGNYTVVSYDADSDELGTEMEVGADGMLYIVGLKDGTTLTGNETEAPKGYNKLTSEVQVPAQKLSEEIFNTSGTRYYDADGNLVKEESASATNKTVEKNLDELDPAAVEVVNKEGTVLPDTGGIGTTMFYVIGGILMVCAGILLVVRRKAAE